MTDISNFADDSTFLKADSRVGWPNNFLNTLELFSPKKKSYSISTFVQSSFSTKKSPKVVNLPLTDETLCLGFWRHKQDKWLLQFSKLLSGSYVSLELISQKLYAILKILLNH